MLALLIRFELMPAPQRGCAIHYTITKFYSHSFCQIPDFELSHTLQ